MSEKFKRSIDLQLFAEDEGEVNATQQEQPVENTNQEEAIKDDGDPIEVLRETAIQLGLNPEDVAIMTKKELQSQIDKAVTQAIKTREEKLRKKAEIEKMKEKGQYEQLLRQERREALEDLKNTYLQAKGLPLEFGALITVDPLVDKSLSEAKEELVEAVESITAKINEIIEAKVNERLKTLESGTFTSTKNAEKVLPNDPKEALRQLFTQKKK
ncbi:hypothetical protein H17ap60334_04922 [Thermosipho africanus H17ap60334]|uniref:DUF4355 domain-containing protein n=1 Tax=Thermosipho africanus TaxID=2421 RepID=UPI00028EAD1C|nr:DUF4355 domain-containing protein [Thermosipho africanus]EKF49526.1 hypothetical protein H17ap60334_04922 [Thermosipho africanus H17ap60334]